MRRVDPIHRSLGQFFHDEVATPLGLDFYIRLPESIPNSRLATLAKPRPAALLLHFPIRLTLAALNHRSNIYRALSVNPGSEIVHDRERVYARDLEVPSGGGVGTARAIARAYGVFASGGRELGLRPETLKALAAPALPPTRGFYDECMMIDDGGGFSLGFMKPGRVMADLFFAPLGFLVFEPAHFIMEHKMLTEIKARAERLRGVSPIICDRHASDRLPAPLGCPEV